jgi:hypothetical protein
VDIEKGLEGNSCDLIKYCVILSHHLPMGTEENYKNLSQEIASVPPGI